MKSSTTNVDRGDRTASREVRRRQLIKATIDSIAKRGLSDTTLATVTRGAKLSHGTINFHFKSKDLLLIETLRFLAEEHHDYWRASLERAGAAPEEQLTALIETDFTPTICNPKKLSVWFAYWGEAKARPAYMELCGKYDQERLNKFTSLFRQLKENGNYSHINPTIAAKSLEAFIDGLWLNMLLYPKVFLREEARRDCFVFLAGMFPLHFPLPEESSDCCARSDRRASEQSP